MGRILKPRILLIGTLPPPVHGSAVVSQQIKDSKVINDAFRCDWVNLGTSRKMDEIGKKKVIKLFRFLGSYFMVLWLLLRNKYDLCYLAITCHGLGFIKDAPYVFLCKIFNKKIVIHQHNKGMINDSGRWPYRWLLPLCYRKTKVILLSWYLYQDIERIVPKENVLICPNGIKIDERKVSRILNLKEIDSVPRLLFLSNLIKSKGVIVLLDSLKVLAEKGYAFYCYFVGGETKEIDANLFSKEVECRGLNNFVFYKGRLYGEEKDEMFENSDIFVFPTYYANETFGLVNLEAMSHFLPIVSTNEGGIPDVVIDGVNGLICEKNNAASLAQCIEKLINNPDLRHKMGIEGRRILKENFTEDVFEKRMKDIFEGLLK